MTKDELIKFLKEHLKIELDTRREEYRTYLEVIIKIDDEIISSSINKDVEL